jgi:hypothetical protein
MFIYCMYESIVTKTIQNKLHADNGYHVVSVTDPYCRILGFLDRSRYFFIK